MSDPYSTPSNTGPNDQPGPPPPYGHQGPPAYGQYASMPTAPPATPYGAVGPQLRVGDALSFAWAKFTRNWLAWVVFSVAFAVVYGVLVAPITGQYTEWVGRVVDAALAGSTVVPPFTIGAGAVAVALIGSLLALVAQVLVWGAALSEADGARPSLGHFFRVRHLGMAVLTAIVVGVVGSVISVVPFAPIAWAIFSVFAIAVVVDHGRSAFQAIGESVRLAARNFGPVFLLMLTLLGINILGAIALVVGLFVTVPLSMLALAYAFRRLAGGTII